ncbi:hypothetical protein LOAG_18675 [Loa loa]|nr:hypothetical protein LOAG_18675 [Loa loa]EJD73938.1 hypothetical protein LOAG_18675 [Loa loa]
MPAVKFASRLRKVLPCKNAKTSGVVIKPRFVRNASAGYPFISRGLQRNLNALIDVYSLTADMKPSEMAPSTVKSRVIQSTEEDDEDLELVVDSDEDNIVDNNKEEIISQTSARNDRMNSKLGSISKESRHYRTESICLEMGYEEDPSSES